jgi:orotate phosphoribosyltransferase
MDCVSYYGGRLAGISALFVASPENQKDQINALFTSNDIPGYKLFPTAECELCKAGVKLDAIVSSEGYTKINQ